MRLLVQRVKEAHVVVDGVTVGSIKKGLLVFLGIRKSDQSTLISPMVSKLLNLRIFPDQEGKMNLSVQDVNGEVLVVSQFTLYADCSSGRRPSFTEAMGGPFAEDVYNQFVKKVKEDLGFVQTGSFGAKMEVSLINDGPVTCIIELEINS